MNKAVKLLVIVATVVIAFGAVGSVYAQGGGPGVNAAGVGQGFGNGFRGDNGERLNQYQGTGPSTMDGVLHETWMAAYAEAFGIEVEELNARLAAGESMSEIALSLGFTVETFWELKMDVRTSVIEQAVADGTLPDELASRMSSGGPGNRSGQGFGGQGLGLGDCPYDEVED